MSEVLPRLILIADRFTDPTVVERSVELVEAGVRWVQLRDHDADEDRFRAAAESLSTRLREVGGADLQLSINRRVEVAVDLDTGCHLPAWSEDPAGARRALAPGRPFGVSAHDRGEIESACSAEAEYVTVSPVYPTESKPDEPPAGLDALGAAVEAAAPIPVFALGGVTPDRVAPCRAAGAYGVAVLSGLLRAELPRRAARRYLDALAE